MVLRVNSQTEATFYDQPCVSSWREVLPLFSVTRTCVVSKSNASAAAPTSASVGIFRSNDEGPKAAEMVLRVITETQTTIWRSAARQLFEYPPSFSATRTCTVSCK